MKKTYRFSDGDLLSAEPEELREIAKQYQAYIQNYRDVEVSLDDPSYVARGNGFCDAKYSEDFLDGQIHKYEQRIRDLENWMQKE